MNKQIKLIKDYAKSHKILSLIFILILLAFFVEIYHVYKPMPQELSILSEEQYISDKDISFLYDLTYISPNGSKIYSQEIFDSLLDLVNTSKSFLVFDMFLFNAGYTSKSDQRNITRELVSALINKKQNSPETYIHFTTDPINDLYGSYRLDEHQQLINANISLVSTNIPALRDSNPLFSMWWRTYFQWFGVSTFKFVPNPIGGDHKISPFALFTLLNTKANHRKVFISDSDSSESRLFITSLNPHEASSMHSNIAFIVNNTKLSSIALESERRIASLAGVSIPENLIKEGSDSIQSDSPISVQFVTEGAILRSLIKDIKESSSGDKIDIAMFYLSERKIINELLSASERGVEINLILDPNKDAFTREKSGIPTRMVANELLTRSNGKIQVRWYKTTGEQFHSKLIIFTKSDGRIIIYGGSANLTKRNIGDLNLEANLRIVSPQNTNLAMEITNYYERLWTNEDGIFTTDFEEYKVTSKVKYLTYRFQEYTGMSTF